MSPTTLISLIPQSTSPVGQGGRIKSKVLHPPNELIRPWRDEKRGKREHKEGVNGFVLKAVSERISQYLVDYLISFLIPALPTAALNGHVHNVKRNTSCSSLHVLPPESSKTCKDKFISFGLRPKQMKN